MRWNLKVNGKVVSTVLVSKCTGDFKAGFLSTFTAQLIALVSTIIDTIAGLPLRNVFSIHTLKGVLCWRNCKVGIIFVKFVEW